MTGALQGLRVVEIANEISGPYRGKLFVDLGAEVTKIEPPTRDTLRRWGPFPGGVADPIARVCSSPSTPASAAPSLTSHVRAARRWPVS